MDKLLTIDLHGVGSRLADILKDPGSNPQAAGLLIAIVTLVVLILLLVAVMVIMARPDEDEEWEDEEWEQAGEGATGEPGEPAPRRPRSVAFAIVLGVGMLIWIVTGVVTSQPSLCNSCHAGNPHASAGKADPHSTLNCVACHETGGTIGSVTYMALPRWVHFARGILYPKSEDGYAGTVPSGACLRCHGAEIARTVTIPGQGVRVSHKEPLAAGAECVDCHKLVDGAVAQQTVGMTPCLRCHDGRTVSSGCPTCHQKDIAYAVKPSADTTHAAQDLVETPNCYACHQPKKCDACHGIRMPHTPLFKRGGHAREAVIDEWTNGGRTCRRCHTADHNPCSGCHADPLPQHGLAWAKEHQYSDPKTCSIGCHGMQTGSGTRLICSFCHDSSIKPLPHPSAVTSSTTTTGTGG